MKTPFNKRPESTEIGGQLQRAGYRLTRARRAVIRTLTEAADWLSPEQVHQQARRFWRPLGLVTVYRTLALLLELGFVRRVHSDQRCLGYARTELAHGHYLLCRGCHQAVEFPGTEDLQPLVNRISQTTGFLVDEHLLELHGLCPACQAATPAL